MLTPAETCLDFSGSDFKEPLSVEDLCAAINADKYPLFLDSERDTISDLNAILTVPNFYEMVCSRTGRDVNAFSKDTQALIVKTSGYRNGKDFSRLNDDEQNSIRMLNRLLLEDVYTNLTPKYLARASKMIYLRPDDMVYVPKRTLKKMAEFMTDLRSIAMFNGWGAKYWFWLSIAHGTGTLCDSPGWKSNDNTDRTVVKAFPHVQESHVGQGFSLAGLCVVNKGFSHVRGMHRSQAPAWEREIQ